MPTGEPEIIVQGKTPQQISTAARTFFQGRGYQERSTDHPSKLAFDRAEGQTDPGRRPETAVRVRLIVHPLSNGSVQVKGYSYRVLRWQQYLEEENAVIAAHPQIQALLNQIKANLDATR